MLPVSPGDPAAMQGVQQPGGGPGDSVTPDGSPPHISAELRYVLFSRPGGLWPSRWKAGQWPWERGGWGAGLGQEGSWSQGQGSAQE